MNHVKLFEQFVNEGISYLELTDGDTTVSLSKRGGKWYEDSVIDGEEPYGWGSKTYQSYLEPGDIASYLSKDYGGRWTVSLKESRRINEADAIKDVSVVDNKDFAAV